MAQVPAHIQQVIRHRAGGAAIEDIEKGKAADGKDAYQAAYKKDGKHVELRVMGDGTRVREVADGKPLYWSKRINFATVPAKTQQIVKSKAGSAAITSTETGVNKGTRFYRFFYDKNGKKTELRMSHDGTFVREVAAGEPGFFEPAGARRK